MQTPAPTADRAQRTVHPSGPFSFPMTLALLRRRGHDLVDIAGDGRYQRLLDREGRPLLLTVTADEATSQALRLELHNPAGTIDVADLDFAETALRRIAALDTSPLPFYEHVRDDPILGPLTHRYRGMRPFGSPTIFEMLVIAILGQQISMIAAGAIKRRLVQSLGLAATIDDRSYYAFPTPGAIAAAGHDDLLALAFSRRKAEYVRDLALAVATGDLDLEAMRGLPHQEILDRLVALRGIGRWTAEYVLLRGFGYPDALPAGDAGLRRQIALLYALPTPPTEAEIIALAEPWRPYRSWATLHLWNAHLPLDSTSAPASSLETM